MILLLCFSKYLSNFNKILAILELNIDKLKNILKFVKHSQVFGGKGIKIGINWKKLIHILLFCFSFFKCSRIAVECLKKDRKGTCQNSSLELPTFQCV